jgi:phospholipid-binding lipoprotein MlaA
LGLPLLRFKSINLGYTYRRLWFIKDESIVMNYVNYWLGLLLLVANTLALAQESTTQETNEESYIREEAAIDPWENYNRHIFEFNEQLDKYIAKPVAQGYKDITPDTVEESVTNVFDNAGNVVTITNDVFQLKGHQAASDTARFLLNSTFGLLGIFDVASKVGLEKHKEDFGQTFGYWGVDSGNYIVWPILGPSTLRDSVGMVPDRAIDPISNWHNVSQRNTATGLKMVDTRANLLDAEKVISGDRYLFIRDAYLQHREYLVQDGEVEDSFGEDF